VEFVRYEGYDQFFGYNSSTRQWCPNAETQNWVKYNLFIKWNICIVISSQWAKVDADNIVYPGNKKNHKYPLQSHSWIMDLKKVVHRVTKPHKR